jgi:hypothetical protein
MSDSGDSSGVHPDTVSIGGNGVLQPYASPMESPDPTPPKIDLRDANAIRRELASVYRDMRGGRIETSDGTRLAYVLDLIRKAFETGQLQDRLEAVERTLEARRAREKALAANKPKTGKGQGSRPWGQT